MRVKIADLSWWLLLSWLNRNQIFKPFWTASIKYEYKTSNVRTRIKRRKLLNGFFKFPATVFDLRNSKKALWELRIQRLEAKEENKTEKRIRYKQPELCQ